MFDLFTAEYIENGSISQQQALAVLELIAIVDTKSLHLFTLDKQFFCSPSFSSIGID